MVDPSDERQVVLLAQTGDPAAVEALLVAVEPALSRYVTGSWARSPRRTCSKTSS